MDAAGRLFRGRSLLTLPGPYECPEQGIPPSTLERAIAGPELVFYREYLATPGAAEREMELDVASWLRDAYYSYSASAPHSDRIHQVAASGPGDDELLGLIRRSAACIRPGGNWRDRFTHAPPALPPWMDADVMDFYAAEFERTGVTGALNWYRNRDLNWELLRPYAREPIRVPALYLEGDRDPATMMLKDAVARMATRVPRLTHRTISECGHWIGEERPEETNEALLDFLDGARLQRTGQAQTAAPARSAR
jgi:pimeloyl-ACP methyl ester carboxylesterase